MNRLRFPPLALLFAAAALATGGCGDDGGSDAAGTTATPAATAEETQSVPTVDGFLISADEQAVVLRTPGGEESFSVDPADLEAVGIPHLASHAGLTDLGFRVYYEEQGGQKFIKGSEEIPPPF